jgi:hypothetical protein
MPLDMVGGAAHLQYPVISALALLASFGNQRGQRTHPLRSPGGWPKA